MYMHMHMQVTTINLKRGMDLKDIKMRYMGRLGGRKRRKMDYIIISKGKTNN